jgi:hypothetical protein
MTDEQDRAFVEEQIRANLGGDLRATPDLLADHYVEEYPQSGEVIRGRANALAQAAANPEPPQLIGSPRLTWCGDSLMAAEARADYPDGVWWVIALYEVAGRIVTRETAYYAAPVPPATWRTPYVIAIPDAELLGGAGGHQAVDRALVDRYFAAMSANDFDVLGRMRHRDFVSDMPQAGERYPSHDAQATAEQAYPGGLPAVSGERLRGPQDAWTVGPSFGVLRVSGRGAHWACEALLTYPSGERSHSVIMLDFRDGLVVRERQYYCASFERAAWRAPWVEPG